MKCTGCNSENVFFSKKRQCYVCEDCEHEFSLAKKHKVFFSYGHDSNAEFVERIKKYFESRDIDVWFDASEIKEGDDWRRKITEGILESDAVVVFMSKHSVRVPGVCLNEIRIASKEKEGRIITVLLEPKKEAPPPVSVSGLQYLNFSDWRNADENELSCQLYNAVTKRINDVPQDDIESLVHSLGVTISDTKENYLLGKPFYGREWLMNSVEDWRTNNVLSRAFILLGTPGTGKSSFAARLARGNQHVKATLFCEWDNHSSNNAKAIIKALAYKLSIGLPDYRTILFARIKSYSSGFDKYSIEELFDILITTPLSELIGGSRERQMIVIDGLDEVNAQDKEVFCRAITKGINKLPQWLCFVLTGRPESTLKAIFDEFRPHSINQHSKRNLEDIESYLQAELNDRLNLSVDIYKLSNIAEKSEGSFLYASLFVESVEKDEIKPNETGSYPNGLQAFYLQDFRRSYSDARAYDEIKEILEVLVAAKSLPLELLQKYSGSNSYQINGFKRFMGSMLKEYIVRPLFDIDEEIKYVSFCHKSISDWLTDAERSDIFYIDEEYGYKKAALGCRATIGNKKNYFAEETAVLRYAQENICNFSVNAKMWPELEQYLTESDTPLAPYWDIFTDFPQIWNKSNLVIAFWNHAEKVKFLTSKQKSGQTKYILALSDEILKIKSLEDFDILLFNIYFDTVHLSGDYYKAVAMCDEYLKHHDEEEIINSKGLLRIAARKLHHSMFFAPVKELIGEALRLEKSVDKDKLPEEYAELVNLAGGNLGILSGDFVFAKKWQDIGWDFVVKKGLKDYKLRFLRKRLDRMCIDGDIAAAAKEIQEYVDYESNDDSHLSRYQIYLLGTAAEIQRHLGNRVLSERLFERLLYAASERGIKGWIGHALLGKANLCYTGSDYGKASQLLAEAGSIYYTLNQKWGIINTGILNVKMQIAQNIPEYKSEAKQLLAMSRELQYDFYITMLEDILSGKTISDHQLLFL